MKKLFGGSIFWSSFLLVLAGALLLALASISVTLLTPIPFEVPVSTLDVSRALKGEPYAKKGNLVVRRESRTFGLGPKQDSAVTEALTVIIARQADVPQSSVRLVLGRVPQNSRSAGPNAPRRVFDEELLKTARLYKNDDRFSPNILGPFTAALLLPDGSWRVASNKLPEPRWQYNVAKGIVIALLLILPLTWWFSRRLAAPIIALGKSADRIGSGSFEEVKVNGPKEVRQAAIAMNKMQARIHTQIKERTEMLAAIAHDLRTPLARLTFLLANQDLPNRHKVQDEIDEMDQMISGAMDYVRSETVEPVREKIDLNLLLESIVDDLVDMGHSAKLQSGPSITISADPAMLRRVFTNVIGNAVKHGQKAYVITYSDAKTAAIEVRDEGPGMSEQDLALAFDPFFRAERSRNRNTGGSGLGLAIAKRGVEAHQGQITLNNRPGGGLIVTIVLPIQ